VDNKTIEVTVRGDYITLGQLLKVAGIAQTGGHGKLLLEEGGITVNNELENRRGKKLRPGDVITMPTGEIVTLI
jgi:ribosome-associated protein